MRGNILCILSVVRLCTPSPDMENSILPLGSLHCSYHLDLTGLIDGNSLYLFSHHQKFHDTELVLHNSIDTSWMIFIFSPQSNLHAVLPTIRSQPLEALGGGMVPFKPPNTHSQTPALSQVPHWCPPWVILTQKAGCRGITISSAISAARTFIPILFHVPTGSWPQEMS